MAACLLARVTAAGTTASGVGSFAVQRANVEDDDVRSVELEKVACK